MKASGALEIIDITIKPEAIDPDDPEMLQDLLVSAVNGAIAAAQALQQQKMMGQLGGLGARPARHVPGLKTAVVLPLRRQPDHAACAAAGGGPAHGAAAGVHFLLRVATPTQAMALADAIREVKERITASARECFNLAEGELCPICQDARRDRSLICVVEDPSDIVALERTHEFRGVYHVLGGALSPIDGVDPEHLRIAELLRPGRAETGHRGACWPPTPR